MRKFFRRTVRVLMVLVIVFTLSVTYFCKYADEPAVFLDERDGRYLFGYDPRQGRWLINERPQYWLGTDGPHIFYRPDSTAKAVFVRGDTSNLAIVQEAFSPQSRKHFVCTVDNATLSTFPIRLKESLHIAPSTYPAPHKLLALSDIEGNFTAFARLLSAAGVVDSVQDGDLRWTFGDGHLVLLGDFMDRGDNVTQCLWLIYKLEDEARTAGGAVHFILGNHEQLNLQGIVKYVTPKYQELRRRLDIPYAALYGKDTELGRWLRTKNCIEKIGDDVFVHGGVSPGIAAARYPSLSDINARMRSAIDCEEADITDARTRALLGDDGILWYRGMVEEYGRKPKLSVEEVRTVLAALGARRLFTGHTLVRRVSTDHGGQVVRLDVPHAEGVSQAMLMDGGALFLTDATGTRTPFQ